MRWIDHFDHACSESGASALELEQSLLLALVPPSALCLTPTPTIASEAALQRMNDGRYQANRYNQRAHYNAAVSKVKVWCRAPLQFWV